MNITFNGKVYDIKKLALHAHTGHIEEINPDTVVCMGNNHETTVGYKHDGKIYLLLGNLVSVKKQNNKILIINKHALKKADASVVWVDPTKQEKPISAFNRPVRRYR